MNDSDQSNGLIGLLTEIYRKDGLTAIFIIAFLWVLFREVLPEILKHKRKMAEIQNKYRFEENKRVEVFKKRSQKRTPPNDQAGS